MVALNFCTFLTEYRILPKNCILFKENTSSIYAKSKLSMQLLQRYSRTNNAI
jgi:hypothetical protein